VLLVEIRVACRRNLGEIFDGGKFMCVELAHKFKFMCVKLTCAHHS
jgi:hypothetical protein